MYLHYVMVSLITSEPIDAAKLVKEAVNTMTDVVHGDATAAIDVDDERPAEHLSIDVMKRMLARKEEFVV